MKNRPHANDLRPKNISQFDSDYLLQIRDRCQYLLRQELDKNEPNGDKFIKYHNDSIIIENELDKRQDRTYRQDLFYTLQ